MALLVIGGSNIKASEDMSHEEAIERILGADIPVPSWMHGLNAPDSQSQVGRVARSILGHL